MKKATSISPAAASYPKVVTIPISSIQGKNMAVTNLTCHAARRRLLGQKTPCFYMFFNDFQLLFNCFSATERLGDSLEHEASLIALSPVDQEDVEDACQHSQGLED